LTYFSARVKMTSLFFLFLSVQYQSYPQKSQTPICSRRTILSVPKDG
jgi:hypothetical protein